MDRGNAAAAEPTPGDGAESQRAKSIALWSKIMIGAVAVGIVATSARVLQLKVSPRPELVSSMVRPNGQLLQQRASLDPEPRGRILDRAGRLLAIDSVGGTVFIDVRDLYVDARMKAKR
ncbi:MAG: hypothetical protein ACKO0W_03965, partial [Planctomycetota bacterium]